MLLKLNGKDIMNCSEEDLTVLLNEDNDYRENDNLEFKRCFSHLESTDNQDKEAKRAEYKCDVCSFANADGGYLIYGIAEANGRASLISGIDIPDNNTDSFENKRRNELNGILPKVPNIKFAFIKLSTGKYVVVIHINADSYAPYIFLEKEKYYRIYRRSGNGKSVVGYTELKRLFNNSLYLEQSVYDYIFDRINYYRFRNEKCGDRFIHVCIIPETFKDSYYNHNMYLLEKSQGRSFSSVFNEFSCSTPSVPCVDGIHFVPYSDDVEYADCYVKNNGVIEACLSLKKNIHDGYLPWGYLWDKLYAVNSNGLQLYKDIPLDGRVFLCLSIIGCKGLISDSVQSSNKNRGIVDRDEIVCEPIAVDINAEDDTIEKTLKQLKLAFLLSIGVNNRQELNNLISELQQ